MPDQQINVQHIAKLARLNLSEKEIQIFQPQLQSILGYVDKLAQLDLEGIEPTAYATPVFNTIREDQAKPGLSREAFLQNAPEQSNDQIKVPKVIEA